VPAQKGAIADIDTVPPAIWPPRSAEGPPERNTVTTQTNLPELILFYQGGDARSIFPPHHVT
jgi:hypothetical protein